MLTEQYENNEEEEMWQQRLAAEHAIEAQNDYRYYDPITSPDDPWLQMKTSYNMTCLLYTSDAADE